MCPLLSAPSTASSSCLTPSPYLSGPLSFRQQMVPLCRISRSTASSPSLEFALHQRYRLPVHFHFHSAQASLAICGFLRKSRILLSVHQKLKMLYSPTRLTINLSCHIRQAD